MYLGGCRAAGADQPPTQVRSSPEGEDQEMRPMLESRRWITRPVAAGRRRRTALVAGGIVAATVLALSPLAMPAAYADSTAVAAIFYQQAGSHRLWLIGPDRVPTDTGVGVAPDSSPAGVQAPGSTSMVVF